MSNAENVSIILCTIIASDSLDRVFKGDAANKPRLAEFHEFRRSLRDSLRRIKKFFILHRIDMTVMPMNS